MAAVATTTVFPGLPRPNNRITDSGKP